MTTFENIRASSEAAGFRLLARSLPGLMQAMAQPNEEEVRNRLLRITADVALHLKAEICSIFLLKPDKDGDLQLKLEGAYGYDRKALGTIKSQTKGLTATIINNRRALICNFNVQDHPKWQGELDDKLQGHCWCLLGVPIIGTNGIVRGAIKVENKSSGWVRLGGTEDVTEVCTFLRVVAEPRNTPQFIAESVQKLLALAGGGGRTQDEKSALRELLQEANRVAKRVAGFRLFVEVPFTQEGEIDEKMEAAALALLVPGDLQKEMESFQWHVEALVAVCLRLKHFADHNSEFFPEQTAASVSTIAQTLINLLESLRLSLRAYHPFGAEDLYLMQTIAAMIAAAIDIRETARAESYHAFQHALRNVGANFLGEVHRVASYIGQAAARPADVTIDLKNLYTTALYISGPQEALDGYWETTRSGKPISFRTFHRRRLWSRWLFYRDFVKLNDKSLVFPDFGVTDYPEWAQRLKLSSAVCNSIVGAMDILVVNAVEWGGSNISIKVSVLSDVIVIGVSDDGKYGYPESLLRDFSAERPLGWRTHAKGSFGLEAAKRVLSKWHICLRLENDPQGGAVASIVVPVTEN